MQDTDRKSLKLSLSFSCDWIDMFRAIKDKSYIFDLTIVNFSWSYDPGILAFYISLLGFGVLIEIFLKGGDTDIDTANIIDDEDDD